MGSEDKLKEVEEGLRKCELESDESNQKHPVQDDQNENNSVKETETKKNKNDGFDYNAILEEIPTLAILFMLIFFIFKIISVSMFKLQTLPLIILSFLVSIGILYLKNRPTSKLVKAD